EEYDGQVAGWVLRKLTFEEWSYVNQPSDVLAVNVMVDGKEPGSQGHQKVVAQSVGEKVAEDENTTPPSSSKPKYQIPFMLGTRKEAYLAHQILHEWAKDPSKTSYTPEEIRKEHE